MRNPFAKTKKEPIEIKIHSGEIVGKEIEEVGKLVFKKIVYYLVYKIDKLKDPVTQENFIHRIPVKMEEFYTKEVGDSLRLAFETFDGLIWIPKGIQK